MYDVPLNVLGLSAVDSRFVGKGHVMLATKDISDIHMMENAMLFSLAHSVLLCTSKS